MLAATLATAALAATSFTIDVRDTGEIRRVGDLKPKQYLGEEGFNNGVVPNRRNAIRAYGRPDRRDENGCGNIWRRLGLQLITADFSGGPPCTDRTRIQRIEITSDEWVTERGQRVADAPGFDAVNAGMRAGRFTGLGEIRVPLTLAWAEHDRLVAPPRDVPATARQFVLRGCGHMPTWDDPEQVAEVLLAGSQSPAP